jgi:hypothetical protein
VTDTVTSQEVAVDVVEIETPTIVTEVALDTTITTQEDVTTIVESTVTETILEEVAAQEVVEACAQGPSGPPGGEGPEGPVGPVGPVGPPGAGSAIPVRVYVPVATTAVIEALPMAVFRSAKWMLTVTDRFGGRYRMGEILALHDGVDTSYVHYAIHGGAVSYAVDVVVIGGDMVLRVTNADAVELVVDAVRIGHLATI